MKNPIPKIRIGTSVVIQVLLMAIIIGAINYLGFHYYERFDFSRSQEFRLSTLTQQAIRQLKKPVRITVYFSPSFQSVESEIYPDVVNLLKELQFAAKKNLEVEFIDPMRNLQRARELQTQYQFDAEENVLIIEYDGRQRFVSASEMADVDTTPATYGEAPRVTAFRGEQAITSSLLSLLDPREHKVYFTQGHGEPGIDEGISLLLDYTKRQNAIPTPLNLASQRSVPSDASAVIIIGPKFDFTPEEVSALQEYWHRDGRVLILLNPEAGTGNLDAFCAQVGIQPEKNRVLRVVPLGFAMGILREVTGNFLPDSEVTKRLAGVNAYFPNNTQSLVPEQNQAVKEAVTLRPLIVALEEYWGETNYVTNEEKGVRFDQGVDRGPPVYLAISADRSGIKDNRVEISAAKMIVVGNFEFALDPYLSNLSSNVANIDFLVSSINWLLDRSKLTGIIPKTRQEFRLALTDAQLGQIALYTMIVIPSVAALLGLILWIRRRK